MELKVLGIGCANCQTLEQRAREALLQLGVAADVTKVTDFDDIAAYGVMRLPALVVGDKVILAGRVPKTEELVSLLAHESPAPEVER
ncbi:MAG TPA: thioredoxin family protein [Acidimicrobiia bacterium]